MRTTFLSFVASLAVAGVAHAAAKTNTLVAVTQEQDQWCWAGTTRSALLYFGVEKKQCELAEWARLNNTAYDLNLGNSNCCTNPKGACNSWNYFWGSGGSIEDLLRHFGAAKVTRYDMPRGTVSLAQLTTAIDGGKLVFIRWEWDDGGGHFIVGDGYDGSLVHYMNPWPGEGVKLAEHAWVVSGDTHRWTSSLVVSADGPCAGKPNGTACDDKDPCTTGDQCTSGACAGAPVRCASSNPCMSGATCSPATGLCTGGTRRPDGADCDDGDACTASDECRQGVCGGTAKACTAAAACHQPGTCDSATGQCTNGASKADGTGCDDRDSCTTADRCLSGVCQGAAKLCVAIDECHEAGTCEPATGLCSTPTTFDGTVCSSGTCRTGVCRAPVDAGVDAPTMEGSGCASAGSAGLIWPLALGWLLALWRPDRRRARHHREES